MSAPASMLPDAANDARPALPVFFATRAGATAHACRAARDGNPARPVSGIPFVDDAFTAADGEGPVFRIVLGLEWEVRQVRPTELLRLVEQGKRAAVSKLLAQAKAHDTARALSRMPAIQGMHERGARSCRDQARAIEATMTLSVAARDVVDVANDLCADARASKEGA